MRRKPSAKAKRPIVPLFVLALITALPAAARSGAAQGKTQDKKSDDATTFLLIHVVGGKKAVPVANASVYLRFTEKSALLFLLRRNKRIELDLKTDNSGYASFPVLPQGKLLIQVVARGWQTFGEYYLLNQPKQTIQIKIEPPKTHWY